MGFLLLGVDSLIACIAIGPIMSRRLAACSALVVLFGVGDGGGFLLGTAFHWSISDSLSNFVQTGILVALGSTTREAVSDGYLDFARGLVPAGRQASWPADSG